MPRVSQRLLRIEHLRLPSEFRRVYDHRRSASDSFMVVYARENERAHARLGISASRRIGNAVIRNRWKRLIREAFRLSREELPSRVDLIVIPRAGVTPTLDGVRRSLLRLSRKVVEKLGQS